MSNKIDEETSVDLTKRSFMVKAGKYAVVGAGMATLMTPGASSAGNYKHPKHPERPKHHKRPKNHKRRKGNNGWGNGNQSAPGNSGGHNNAENGRRKHRKHGQAKP